VEGDHPSESFVEGAPALRGGLGKLLDLPVPQEQIEANGFRIVEREGLRHPQERLPLAKPVVVRVPSAESLVFVEARKPLLKDLALAVRLSADRVVAKDEANGKDASTGKDRLVPPGRGQVDRPERAFPAPDLRVVGDLSPLVELEGVADGVPRLEAVVGRPEVEHFEVDGVEA